MNLRYFILFLCCLSLIACNKKKEVIEINSCKYSDEPVIISWNNCYCYAFNAFTPNNDQLNDFFGPTLTKHSFYRFSVKGFNETDIFSTTDEKIKWDGKVNNIMQDEGIYTGRIVAKLDCGINIDTSFCFYLLKYNSANCLIDPSTNGLNFQSQFDPISLTNLYLSGETVCP